MPYTDYANRLLNLHLPSLEHRMIYFDMIMYFKIINYSVDIIFLRWCDPQHTHVNFMSPADIIFSLTGFFKFGTPSQIL